MHGVEGAMRTEPTCWTTVALGAVGNPQYVLARTTTMVVPLVTTIVVPLSLSVSWMVPETAGLVVTVAAARVVAVVLVDRVEGVVGAPATVVLVATVVATVVVVVVTLDPVEVLDPQPASRTAGISKLGARIASRLITLQSTVPGRFPSTAARQIQIRFEGMD
jgi:asparagine N-glycosylation enzyme membrane subunit Stt3